MHETSGASAACQPRLRDRQVLAFLLPSTLLSCCAATPYPFFSGGAMHRRTFLKHGVTVSAALLLGRLPKGVYDAYGAEASWRTFEVATRLTIREATGAVRAWVPAPLLHA